MSERVKQFGILALPDKLIRGEIGRGALSQSGEKKIRTPSTFGHLVDAVVDAASGTPEAQDAQSRFSQQVGYLIDNKRSTQGISLMTDLVNALLRERGASEPS